MEARRVTFPEYHAPTDNPTFVLANDLAASLRCACSPQTNQLTCPGF